MEYIRPPAVAGSFYPSDPDELNRLLDDCFFTNTLGPRGAKTASPSLVAGMVPHAGYAFSGACAAHLYAHLDKSIQRVILLGINHWAQGHRAALSSWDAWQTPLGNVPVDQELNNYFAERLSFLEKEKSAHSREHSIEVQLPFLQRTLGDFTIVPISLSSLSREESAELGAAIAEAVETSSNARAVILASSDLSHYLSPRETEELDRMALEKVLALHPDGLSAVVEKANITMCGVLPTTVMLFAVNRLGAKRSRLLKRCHSGDVQPMRKVVGYGSVAIEF
ncbi:MAG TPA: AmmeMemoRadiSam system protein B [Candidatus Udaeobacter sp.]|jgi:AmmeMemoRadiSam system protein B|nr:AmmeMemoRadiSam system protein B [Candidatus Udaeobacter sp.]